MMLSSASVPQRPAHDPPEPQILLDRAGLDAALPFHLTLDQGLRVVGAGPKLAFLLGRPGLGIVEAPYVGDVLSVSHPSELAAAGGWAAGFSSLRALWCGQPGLILDSPSTRAQLRGCLVPAQLDQQGPCLLFVGLPVAPGGDMRELKVSMAACFSHLGMAILASWLCLQSH